VFRFRDRPAKDERCLQAKKGKERERVEGKKYEKRRAGESGRGTSILALGCFGRWAARRVGGELLTVPFTFSLSLKVLTTDLAIHQPPTFGKCHLSSPPLRGEPASQVYCRNLASRRPSLPHSQRQLSRFRAGHALSRWESH